jgi:hypothetical protein
VGLVAEGTSGFVTRLPPWAWRCRQIDSTEIEYAMLFAW